MKMVLKIQPLDKIEGLYHYTASGLDNYWLSSKLYESDEYDGQKTISFSKLDQIHAAIGMHICSLNRPLEAKEVRFLRTEIGLSQADLGQALGYKDKQRVAAAEKQGAKRVALLGPADLLLRNYYLNWLGQQPLAGQAFRDKALQQGQSLNSSLRKEKANWQIAA